MLRPPSVLFGFWGVGVENGLLLLLQRQCDRLGDVESGDVRPGVGEGLGVAEALPLRRPGDQDVLPDQIER